MERVLHVRSASLMRLRVNVAMLTPMLPCHQPKGQVANPTLCQCGASLLISPQNSVTAP